MEKILEEAKLDTYVGSYISSCKPFPITINGITVGIADYQIDDWITMGIGTKVKVRLLYIAKKHRGKGYAKKTLSELATLYNIVELYVSDVNVPMLTLVNKLGYVATANDLGLIGFTYISTK